METAFDKITDELKGDKEIVTAAIANNLIALQYATKTLLNDQDLAKMVLIRDIAFSVQIALDYI